MGWNRKPFHLGVRGITERGTAMREIDNNDLIFRKVDTANIEGQKSPDSVPTENAKEIQVNGTSDLSLAPEAVIGRSQVQMTGASRTDNLEADMDMILKNPDGVKKAVDFFDIAYDKLKASGTDNAYEKAAAMTNIFKEDMLR